MNSKEQDIYELVVNGDQHYLHNVSVDNVIFGYHAKELKVLLQRSPGYTPWVLPGGYIRKTESVETAASRIAQQRTGLDHLFLQQFKVFSDPGRTKDENFSPKIMSSQTGWNVKEDNWMFQPMISIGFYTLTEFSKVTTDSSYYMEDCKWFDVSELPPLLFDHKQITNDAIGALRLHLYHYPIGYELLPEKFTLPEIHTLYETILGKKIDSRNFTKKLISTGTITKLEEQRKIGAHRSPFLYSFNKEVYQEALKQGIALL